MIPQVTEFMMSNAELWLLFCGIDAEGAGVASFEQFSAFVHDHGAMVVAEPRPGWS